MLNPDDAIKFVPSRGIPHRRRSLGLKETGKDFSKVLRKEPRERRQQNKKGEKITKRKEFLDDIAMVEEKPKTVKEKPFVSVFDISPPKEKEENRITALQEYNMELRDESLSALFKYISSKEHLKRFTSKASEAMKKMGNLPKGEFIPQQPQEEALASQFAREQPDLSYINPTSVSETPTMTPEARSVDQSAMVAKIQEIVDQIVDKIYTLSVDGRTDTTITLRHPPMFEGVNIVITEYDTAKGEFNIKFENLTQAAKEIIDLRENQDVLRLGIEQKGLTVHIITATTYIETRPLETEETARGDREGKGDEREQQREREEEE